MRLLAIETATEACSCALFLNGACQEICHVAPRRHAELILPMAARLLAAAELVLQQLDGIAFGRGPGAFTGVRIAAGVAQGLAFGADLPVAPISTLQALAQGAARVNGATAVLPALDARMGEVYWGAYRIDAREQMRVVVEDCVSIADRVPLPQSGDWLGVGDGWVNHGHALAKRVGKGLRDRDPQRFPQAQDVAALAAGIIAAGEGVPAEEAFPLYLRNRVAGKPANRQ